MKKITLLLLLSLSALSLQAQNFYNLTTSQQTYVDLENTTSINNGQVWDFDQFPEITIPFTFKIGGQTVNRFFFEDDYFALVTPNGDIQTEDGVYYLSTSSAFIQDRTSSTGTSTSPISYKVDGETGNHILKLEVKNAGLEEAESLGFSQDHFYLNFQIWLYEADNAIEFRYGNHNITDPTYITDDSDILLIGIDSAIKAYVLSGQTVNPTYAEYNPQDFPEDLTLDAYPANGTVYKLTPASLAGIKDFSTTSVKLYPNPASSVLHIQSAIEVSEYAIYNVVGKLVAQNKISESNNVEISIENLESGLYFVNINNQYLKFIKQ